jgi:hypothetical protein
VGSVDIMATPKFVYFTLQGSSMLPAWGAYSTLVGVVPSEPCNIQVGDFIAFTNAMGHVMHQVVAITSDGKFITKGIANQIEDIYPVTYDQVEAIIIGGFY